MTERSEAETSAILDEMIEVAMESLLSGEAERQAATARILAERWPSETALALTFAITSATAMIEDSFGPTIKDDPVVPMGYRMAATVAADIHALQEMGLSPALAEDLLHYWRRADPTHHRLH